MGFRLILFEPFHVVTRNRFFFAFVDDTVTGYDFGPEFFYPFFAECGPGRLKLEFGSDLYFLPAPVARVVVKGSVAGDFLFDVPGRIASRFHCESADGCPTMRPELVEKR